MTREDFDDLAQAEAGHWWFVGMRAITATLLNGWPPPSRPHRILDAGCGAGYMLNWLRDHARTEAVFGLDFAAEALAHCQRDGAGRLLRASITDLPYDDAAFDVVTCFDVLQQLPHPSADQRALTEFHRVLRPGGTLLTRVAAYRWLWSRHDTHMHTQHRYTLPELREQLTAAGFHVLRSTYALTLLFPLAAAYRGVKQLLPVIPSSDVKLLPRQLSWLNRGLARTLEWEAALLRRHLALPFGMSIVCLARKEG